MYLNRYVLRKCFFTSLALALVYIVYQLYYYRQLVSDTSNKYEEVHHEIRDNSKRKSHPMMQSRFQSTDNLVRDLVGVDPRLEQSYQDAFNFKFGSFRCLNTNEIIERDAFNDDYCDCSDGSDEPSTSACAQHTLFRFFCNSPCSKEPGNEESISYQRVNDGICDCCDGSDELKVSDLATNQFSMQLYQLLHDSMSGIRTAKCFDDIAQRRNKI